MRDEEIVALMVGGVLAGGALIYIAGKKAGEVGALCPPGQHYEIGRGICVADTPTVQNVRLIKTEFDITYRIGDSMNILWTFTHLGPSDTLVLGFGVAPDSTWDFLTGQTQSPPFEVLEKHVVVNADRTYQTYEIDHRWPLESIDALGFYDVVTYIRNSAGKLLDGKRYNQALFAI